MELVAFTVVGVTLYLGSDALLDRIERQRGARFENRQFVFLAIMLPLTLAAFALLRLLFAAPPA